MRRLAALTGRSLAYAALLLPVALATLPPLLVGRTGTVVAMWRGLRARVLGVPSVAAPRRPGVLAVTGHTLLSLLLGVAALPPLGVQLLMVLRGALYGLVEPGPYDTAWGGPTLAGAWLVHFLVAVPTSVAGLALLIAIAALHRRFTAALDGERQRVWALAAALLIGAAMGLFVVAWLQQI
ncbi:hypothetical protein [Micromonospora costi]|uniref:Uncharacterized protein n=1 Tax=Micromonospora costi TaxID=1530042 RepID=A0A3B0AF22_9ACTN|nr:hypothetical protein [Micromonospora costi]RKN58914.1 hypothetical protein D7193_10520 [Micromonospora costi]